MILGNDDRSVTAYSNSGWYYLGEQRPVDVTIENAILKQRCAAHATPDICKLCKFNCSYRKKWSGSNHD